MLFCPGDDKQCPNTKQKTDNTKTTIVNIMIHFKILVTACLLLLLWDNQTFYFSIYFIQFYSGPSESVITYRNHKMALETTESTIHMRISEHQEARLI